MNIKVNWDISDSPQKRIVLMDFHDTWTWDEFHIASRELHKLISSVDQEVNVIICHQVEYPAGNPLTHFQTTMRDQPKNTGRVIVVNLGQSSALISFFGTLGRVFERMFPNKSRIIQARSLDDARALLAGSQV